MIRRWGSGSLVGALLAAFAAAPVAAGGWASVSLDGAVPPPEDGVTLVRVAVLQHGETPVDWGALTLVAVNDETGERAAVAAQPDGGGTWTARLALPSAGSWTLTATHSELEIGWSGPAGLSVGPPTGAAAASTGQQPAPWLGVALVIAALLLPVTGAVILRRRGLGASGPMPEAGRLGG